MRGLECGEPGICTLQSAVEKRLKDRQNSSLSVLCLGRVHEQTGVVCRTADHCGNLSGGRLNGHDEFGFAAASASLRTPGGRCRLESFQVAARHGSAMHVMPFYRICHLYAAICVADKNLDTFVRAGTFFVAFLRQGRRNNRRARNIRRCRFLSVTHLAYVAEDIAAGGRSYCRSNALLYEESGKR